MQVHLPTGLNAKEENVMKKFLSLLFVVIVLTVALTLSACINDTPATTTPTNQNPPIDADECNHSPVIDWSVEPTCTETGLTQGKHCWKCGEAIVPQEEIPALGHNIEIVVPATDPTCEEPGYTEGWECINGCGLHAKPEEIEPLGHIEVIDEKVPATCTSTGLREGRHCSVCGKETVPQTVIPMKSHTEVVDQALEATCTSTGLTEGKHCSVCATVIVEQTVIPALEHNYDSVVKNPTCTEQGYTTYTCQCGETYIGNYVNTLEHNYNSVVKNPTCTEQGYTTYTCGCGYSYVGVYVDVLGHDYKAVVIAPTCTEGGYTTYTCHCGDAYVADKVTALGHTEVVDEAVAPTCTETGLTEGKHCSMCNEVLLVQTIVVANGHNFGNWITVKEATTTEEGLQERTCSCGKKETVAIPVKAPEDPTYVRDGDYIYFGEYPQTIKADDVTITDTQDSRGYYLGSDGSYYAMVIATPVTSNYTFSTGTTVTSGSVYYFKVEPIRWRILSEENGEALIFCDSIIANVAYQPDYYRNYNYYTTANGAPQGTYANNYKYSNVRNWLNSIFYETAFSTLESALILATEVDNSAKSTNPYGNENCWGNGENQFACENTSDKIFLLSMEEVTYFGYGFLLNHNSNDTARKMLTSDYSRATGAYMNTASAYYGIGQWWLRSPKYGVSREVSMIHILGTSNTAYTQDTYIGVVPALRIRL